MLGGPLATITETGHHVTSAWRARAPHPLCRRAQVIARADPRRVPTAPTRTRAVFLARRSTRAQARFETGRAHPDRAPRRPKRASARTGVPIGQVRAPPAPRGARLPKIARARIGWTARPRRDLRAKAHTGQRAMARL